MFNIYIVFQSSEEMLCVCVCVLPHSFLTTILSGSSYLVKKLKYLKWFKIILKDGNIRGLCVSLGKAYQFPVLEEVKIRDVNYPFLAFSYDISDSWFWQHSEYRCTLTKLTTMAKKKKSSNVLIKVTSYSYKS